MKVPADHICEHGMPQPWATCTDCMLLPRDLQPVPPRPEPAPKPTKKPVAKRTAKPRGSSAGSSARRASSTAPSAARLPRSDRDAVPPLTGDKDLAYEIPDTNLRFHVQGPDGAWLPISSMPHELRDLGFVYLQTHRRLVARCRVKGIGFRDRRWTHEPPETASDAGPGATIELHGEDWQFISIDLGSGADAQVRGYRYLITEPDGSVRLPTDEA